MTELGGLNIPLVTTRNSTKCPIDIDVNGIRQSPSSLIEAALANNTLHIRIHNQLSQHIEIHFQEDRSQFSSSVSESPSTSSTVSHCHFSGFTKEGRHALSLCDVKGLSGLLLTQKNRFGIIAEDMSFKMIPYVEKSCDFDTLARTKREINNVIDRNPSYIKEHLDGRKRHVELALVADYSLFAKFESDETKLNDYIQRTINILNSLYHPLNIQVTLVHSEIWKKGDQISVIADSKVTLQNFMDYKKKMLKEHLFDTGYLVTNIRFDEGVVGKAYKGTMCSYDYSGGVYVDHNDDAVETVATFAHELGHTFGMDHDPDDKDICYCPMPKCIMSPQSGHMEVWSECSVKNLASGFGRGIDLCLFNEPGKKPSDAKCGNGIVEPGEECDCGPLKCDNNCCDGSTCKLIGDALCASGDCCDTKTCKPKPRATICRAAIGICDLNEYCNGETSDCPADFFVQNGALCPGRENEFCYEGGCGSRNDQCAKLWGETGSAGDENCYRRNIEGNIYGNCGFNAHTNEFKKCLPEDQKCGLLHCDTQAERPIFGDPGSITFTHSAVYSSLKPDDKKFCYVFKSAYGGLNQPDPGLVPDGSTCGPEQMCIGQKCHKKEKITKLTSQCLDNCNFRGICNNVGNCHCEKGFGGIACEMPGYGGSVNSNDAHTFRGLTISSAFIVLFILFGFFIAGLCIYYKVQRRRNLIKELWRYSKKKFDLHGDLVPVRKAPPPPYAQRIRQSFTAMWGESTPQTNSQPTQNRNGYNTCVRQPPRFDPPSIPMVSLSTPEVASPTPLLHNNFNPTKDVFSIADKKSSESLGTFNRVGSQRPTIEPPPIPRPSEEALSKLKEELNEEKFEKLIKAKPIPPPVPKEMPRSSSSLKRNESIRPDVKPPPPPLPHNKPKLEKPELPSKPPRNVNTSVENNDEPSEKVDVRSMAAIFNKKMEK